MKVLVIAAQKGGSGKSTLARSLAVVALYDNIRAVIVDADPQGTLTRWATRRQAPAPTVVTTAKRPLPEVLAAMKAAGAALAIVDTPPHLRPLISLAAEHATAVIVPVRPSPDDLDAVAGTLEIIRAMGRSAGLVINAAPPRTTAHGLTFARSALTALACPVCPTALADRVAHQYAAATGQTATETDPTGKAASEITAVWQWIRAELILDI